MATVKSGANTTTINVVGRSISSIRSIHGQTLGIDGNSVAFLNGRNVEADYVVRDGDQIEFSKPRGQKG